MHLKHRPQEEGCRAQRVNVEDGERRIRYKEQYEEQHEEQHEEPMEETDQLHANHMKISNAPNAKSLE